MYILASLRKVARNNILRVVECALFNVAESKFYPNFSNAKQIKIKIRRPSLPRVN